jgi:hypothetical protein
VRNYRRGVPGRIARLEDTGHITKSSEGFTEYLSLGICFTKTIGEPFFPIFKRNCFKRLL